jgi:uncharacterized protein (DUF1330 family)
MSTIQSNIDQLKKLSNNPDDRPVTMLNLLKFKKDGGRKLYAKYVKESDRFIQAVGARVIYLGKTAELIYGSESWDAVLLVQYPTRKSFTTMTTDPQYIEVHKFREAALERAVLYATDEVNFRDLLL